MERRTTKTVLREWCKVRTKKHDSLKTKLEDLEADCKKDLKEYDWLREKLLELEKDPNKVL